MDGITQIYAALGRGGVPAEGRSLCAIQIDVGLAAARPPGRDQRDLPACNKDETRHGALRASEADCTPRVVARRTRAPRARVRQLCPSSAALPSCYRSADILAEGGYQLSLQFTSFARTRSCYLPAGKHSANVTAVVPRELQEVAVMLPADMPDLLFAPGPARIFHSVDTG